MIEVCPGYNSGGKYKVKVNGRHQYAYKVWSDMMRRCYMPFTDEMKRVYKGCTVSEDWHDYQDFAEWYEGNQNKGKGYFLDKDLVVKGNKVYSPEFCRLVPREINNLLTDSNIARGEYPQGVYFKKSNNKFVAQVSINGTQKYLGLYKTAEDAYQAYKLEKEKHVKEVAKKWKGRIDDSIFNSLMNWCL